MRSKSCWKKSMTIAERRDVVQFLVERGRSPSRACQLVQVARSTLHYQARPDRNADLVEQVRALAAKHPRYGYRRIHALLRRDQPVNKKRIQRLWQPARLQVRKRTRKRRRAMRSELPVKATHPNHVWTYDFLADHCQNGTLLRILTMMDEFTRQGLAIEVATSIPAARVITILERVVAAHGALAVRRWLAPPGHDALHRPWLGVA
jgi:putative transposase